MGNSKANALRCLSAATQKSCGNFAYIRPASYPPHEKSNPHVPQRMRPAFCIIISRLGGIGRPGAQRDNEVDLVVALALLTAIRVHETIRERVIHPRRGPKEACPGAHSIMKHRHLDLNCATDGVNLTATYRKPFDLIFEGEKNGRDDWI